MRKKGQGWIRVNAHVFGDLSGISKTLHIILNINRKFIPFYLLCLLYFISIYNAPVFMGILSFF